MSDHTLICYPAPLQAGSRIVVTAPSSGVDAPLHRRLDLCLSHLRAQGFVVEEGRCLRSEQHSASAPAHERAAELMQTLLRDDVQAVIPPWGGERAIEVLDRLDWAALQRATPKWVLGFSDTSTWMLPLTLRLGWATAHGACLMDLVAGQSDALTCNTMATLATPAGGQVVQQASNHWQLKWTDFAQVPDTTYQLTEPTRWRALRGETSLQFSGRLIGGCVDTLMHTAGTVHGDVAGFIARHCSAGHAEGGAPANEQRGVILYLENSGLSPTDWLRALHRLRWAGWLQGLAGVLVGRSAAPDTKAAAQLRYADALQATLADLTCPVLVDLDIGHCPPQMVLLNGALAQVDWSNSTPGQLTQELV